MIILKFVNYEYDEMPISVYNKQHNKAPVSFDSNEVTVETLFVNVAVVKLIFKYWDISLVFLHLGLL